MESSFLGRRDSTLDTQGNMGKGGFPFAAAALLPKCLNDFERQYLSRYTPCTEMDIEQLVEAIAIVHIEFILLHPFRDGNGRIARLLADVMAAQSGFETLDYQCWEGNKSHYISAIHAGANMDYEPMKYWVRQALKNN
ncbi:hypothetical protein DDT56_03730 [Brenneria corticis]|uniref:Fido domain-containing protein n=1 Tax=Brenneria corticis TaxID=2173106 RepID=A0A2U1U9Z5_9GAMM|nr:hypothetical protein DDT56_03730 [Brenneria sp. CFCC 11842]